MRLKYIIREVLIFLLWVFIAIVLGGSIVYFFPELGAVMNMDKYHFIIPM